MPFTPFDIYKSFANRRQEKMASGLEKYRAKAALAGIQSEREFRALEDPREQAELRQSLAGRGLSKSSIATQNTARLTDIQARRNAALAMQHESARRGLSLIRKRRKFARRMFPIDLYQQWVQGASEVAGAASQAGAGGE